MTKIALTVIPKKRASGVPATGCWVCRKSSLESLKPVCKAGHEAGPKAHETCGAFRDVRSGSEVIPPGKIQR